MKSLAQMIALGMLSIAVGACSSAQLTPERRAMLDAVQDYNRIAQKANLLYLTDWFGYPPGETAPTRPRDCNQQIISSVRRLSCPRAASVSRYGCEVPTDLNGGAPWWSGLAETIGLSRLRGVDGEQFFASSARLFQRSRPGLAQPMSASHRVFPVAITHRAEGTPPGGFVSVGIRRYGKHETIHRRPRSAWPGRRTACECS